jgi:hypothetical protein
MCQRSCSSLFIKCIVTMTVAARTEVSAAAHVLVLQVRIPSGGLDVSLLLLLFVVR